MLEFFLRSSHGLARARSSSVGPYFDDFAVPSEASLLPTGIFAALNSTTASPGGALEERSAPSVRLDSPCLIEWLTTVCPSRARVRFPSPPRFREQADELNHFSCPPRAKGISDTGGDRGSGAAS